jgi:hypothetical protein
MRKFIIILMPVLFVLLAIFVTVARADDDMLLAQNALHMDYKAEKTGWPTVVFDQLKEEFKVSDARLYSLREKNLSYAEITTVLSLAEQMPGGINDKNITKVLTLRNGGNGGGYTIGWGSVAKALQVKMSRAVSHTQSINESSWTADADQLPKGGMDTAGVKPGWSNVDVPTQWQGQAPRLEEGMKPTRP